jgi:hypothetical protein
VTLGCGLLIRGLWVRAPRGPTMGPTPTQAHPPCVELRRTSGSGHCSSPGECTCRVHVVTDRVRICHLGHRRRAHGPGMVTAGEINAAAEYQPTRHVRVRVVRKAVVPKPTASTVYPGVPRGGTTARSAREAQTPGSASHLPRHGRALPASLQHVLGEAIALHRPARRTGASISGGRRGDLEARPGPADVHAGDGGFPW